MATWQLQEAKAKLSEVIETARKNGPQVITQRGIQTAVIIPFDSWTDSSNSLQQSPEKMEDDRREEFLHFLRSAPHFEIPDRHRERIATRRATAK